ncbi:chromosome transmission fidelity protein 18 homolog [Xylocopa sonorina]|uniref:chromosome transmission fidelity protein 18 homolog n=1 Tax=Xylocopa sonorina TaxID=1818115 RepID=UPI00403B1FF8
MDSEFPDPDEEFDLVHQDEYELLKEIEDLENKKKLGSQNVRNLQEKAKETDDLNAYKSNLYKELNTPTSSRHNELCSPSTSKATECSGNSETDITKKRNYDELFGDISDILDTNSFADILEPREKRPRWDEPEKVIKAILDAREKFHEYTRGGFVKRKYVEEKKDTISLRVPCWNFVAVTRPCDAQRIYLRVRDNTQNRIQTSTRVISNLLSAPYSELKAKAEEIIVENVKRASYETSNLSITKTVDDTELWVDKYRPKSYRDLLSDESVNKQLLHWIKLWDKVVFNRNYVQYKNKRQNFIFRNKKFMDENTVEEVDSKGYPIQKIVLLSGPPGLGKTTLAHLVARHAGYNVIDINASDDRTPDGFRQFLLASTQMKAVIGNDPRPNCLVLDEIDGAPATSIELLLKFVQGKLISKQKKDKMKPDKQSNTCHRPIICICNEPYTPSLRALRAVALIISIPEINSAGLMDRLMEIAKKENLKVNPDALLRLVEMSGCDIRSCLGTLQYMGGISSKDNLSSALKDSRKNLFDSWKQLLTLPMNRNGILPISERVQLVLKTVRNGEPEKLALGIFHNYPEICDDKLNYVTVCLEWFEFFDEILTAIASSQIWSIMPYINYAFVTWHLYFARTRNVKLSYPSILYEVNQKHANSVGILTTIKKSSGRDSTALAVDYAPFLPDLLNPRLRTVSGHLHSTKEKENINRLVNILIDFGLTFTQEKNLDGTFDYKLDPDILRIGIFPDCKYRRTLQHAVKQIIVQELETERLRIATNFITRTTNAAQNRNKENENTAKEKTAVPEISAKIQNNISSTSRATETFKKLEAETKEITYKDFFGRIITVKQDKQQMLDKESSRKSLRKNGAWYKYKEGFSNAVRRKVIIEHLL